MAWQARRVYSSARCICINVKNIQICYQTTGCASPFFQYGDSCSSNACISDNDVHYSKILDVPGFE